ncbi:hypothetical protein [Pseudonocardia sp. GCM10023141]|uniref:hypothetical protein n=1 Tax=Pseudonocardia sp. GCM10023141 TaxID=3252653 RepID=UPI003611D4C6
MVTTLTAIGLATVAAVLFALGVRLQHDAVTTTAAATPDRLPAAALGRAVRSRGWLGGAGLSLLATSMHVVALSLAPLAIVQPVGVLSLVAAVLLGTPSRRSPLPMRARIAIGLVCAGIAGFVTLTALTVTAGAALPSAGMQLVVVAVLVVALFGLRTSGRVRCMALAGSAAVVFGLGSTLIRAASQAVLVLGDVPAGAGFAAEAVLLAGCGTWLIQQAYASGPTAVTVAATTVLDPLTAVVVGIAFCGESMATQPVTAAAQIALALIAVAGVLVLARAAPDEGRVPRTTAPRPFPPPGAPMRC